MTETNKPIAAARYWLGRPPTACDLCARPLGGAFVDGAVRPHGHWALMDLRCARVHGAGLGTGKGQLYRRQDDGRWLKVAG